MSSGAVRGDIGRGDGQGTKTNKIECNPQGVVRGFQRYFRKGGLARVWEHHRKLVV